MEHLDSGKCGKEGKLSQSSLPPLSSILVVSPPGKPQGALGNVLFPPKATAMADF